MRVRGQSRRPHAVLAVAALASSFLACFDLFHSTNFGFCSGDAGDCTDAGPSLSDGGSRRDAGDAHADVTLEAGSDAGADAVADGRSPTDSPGSREDASSQDAHQDTGTNFCSFSPSVAAENAKHACLWLGACAGTADLNAFGTCYPNALLAYDCSLNPNQQVRGALHAYWDALWQADSCEAVLKAIFPSSPATVPVCHSNTHDCAPSPDGGSSTIVQVCAGDGGFASAVNCGMRGYQCLQGTCSLGTVCASVTAPSCSKNILSACQLVATEAGAATGLVDVGRDCSNFGAGQCQATGAVGCLPNDASVRCEAGTTVTCAGDGGSFVTGCATGFQESVQCGAFGMGGQCGSARGAETSGLDLASGCFNPSTEGKTGGSCLGASGFEDNAGPSGVVSVACADAGLDACGNNGGPQPFCTP